jgi:hypothetical protein
VAPTLCAGQDLALALSENCVNKIAAIVYQAGILPTAVEGDLSPVTALAGCLASIPILGPLLADLIKPGSYHFRAELKQPAFDFLGSSQMRITGGADAAILLDGTQQASLTFDLALPVTVSLVSPGSQPAQPDDPQVKVEVGQPEVTPNISGLPAGLEGVVQQLSEAVGTLFVEHVLNIPAFPAFFRDEGYGVVLRSLEVTPDQFIVRAGLEWPGRPVMTKVPFTLRPAHRSQPAQPHPVSGPGAGAASVEAKGYRLLPPIVKPGNPTWPHHGPAEYDFAIALSQRPVQDVLNEKFPFTFSEHLPDPVNDINFTLNASFQLMDAATDKIKLTASITGENSGSALIHCTGQADFTTEVALHRQGQNVKGEVAALGVNARQAKCQNKNTGLEANGSALANWLADQLNLKHAIDQQLTQRFGEPLIPLTFTIFQQAIHDSDLTVSIDLTNVEVVQDELQLWIAVNEAAAPSWHWHLPQLPVAVPVPG